MGRIIPYIMENKECLKPPTSHETTICHGELPKSTVSFDPNHPPSIACDSPSSSVYGLHAVGAHWYTSAKFTLRESNVGFKEGEKNHGWGGGQLANKHVEL